MGRGGGQRHNPATHGRDLEDAAQAIVASVKTRAAALGIDPRLVMVVDTSAVTTSVDSEKEWDRSGLTVVDSSVGRQVIAFSADQELTLFLDRVRRYMQGPPEGQDSAYQESFFGNILKIRPYDFRDRPGSRLRLWLNTDGSDENLLLDVNLWYPGTAEEAASWIEEISIGVRSLEGEVLDTFVSAAAGIAVMRVRVDRNGIQQLLHVDYVAGIELLPPAPRRNTAPSELSADDIGTVPAAERTAPVVGLVDSGVLSSHPLLEGSIVDTVAASPALINGLDRHGHGTAVASIILHGSLESGIREGRWPSPICAVLSVRIFDENLMLPQASLAESELEDALRYLARANVRVVNLSLGDSDIVYSGGRAPSLAALLDSLARELRLVLVVPTGRVAPVEYYFPFDADMADRYVEKLLDDSDTGLLDPAPSALALTVGGSVPPSRASGLHLEPLGNPGWPAPFSRRGPGIGGAVKPEFHAEAGTLAQDRNDLSLAQVDALAIAVADGRPSSSGVVSTDVGSSLSAPLVTRIVAGIETQYPTATSNLLRALALQSAVPSSVQFPDGGATSDSNRADRIRNLLGYGKADLLRAVSSAEREVVLIAEEVISVDDVHLYAVPIPDAFFVPGRADRGLTVSLAYDPPVRARRLDYLGNRMKFDLVRGLPAQEVMDLFLADSDDQVVGPAVEQSEGPRYTRVSDLPDRHRLPLRPSRQARSLGANQWASLTRQRALVDRADLGAEFLLVVHNVNRWDQEGALQPYAIAVRLWVGEQLPELYEEVRVRVEESRLRARAQIRA
jgi:subtilisin family serine protease